MVSRGENKPSPGVGGTSTNCIPGKLGNGPLNGLLVIASTRGDKRALSSAAYGLIVVTCRSGTEVFFSISTGLMMGLGLAFGAFGGALKFSGTKPNPCSCFPNR